MPPTPATSNFTSLVMGNLWPTLCGILPGAANTHHAPCSGHATSHSSFGVMATMETSGRPQARDIHPSAVFLVSRKKLHWRILLVGSKPTPRRFVIVVTQLAGLSLIYASNPAPWRFARCGDGSAACREITRTSGAASRFWGGKAQLFLPFFFLAPAFFPVIS